VVLSEESTGPGAVRLAYIILAHRDPSNIARLATRLTESGATVAIHYDLKAPASDFQEIGSALKPLADKVVLVERITVGWGEWSIVQATLNALRALAATGRTFDYVHLMSGMDYPIKPLRAFEAFLERRAGTEFIQTTNIREKSWIKGGLEHERYQFRHIHNWQTQRKEFDRHWKSQQRKGRKRNFLPGLAPYLGSQWWTLTWSTCLGALRWSEAPGVTEFFQTVWIPDEMFFQTFVGNNIKPSKISVATLTFYQFTDKGIPAVFYNDHLHYLSLHEEYFARKLSPYADKLRDGLDANLSHPVSTPWSEVPVPLARYSEIMELHRRGLPNRRVVGYAKDAWYGDLEWNRDPYLVVLAQSASAAVRVCDALSSLTGVVCHGELFSGAEIQFAGGVGQFAGYRSDDVALRDHNRRNFLVDVIKQGAPALTCFVLSMRHLDDFHNVLFWDPRAHFVLIKPDLVGGFDEEQRYLSALKGGRDNADHAEADRAEMADFIAFARKFADNQRGEVVTKTLGYAGKKPIVLITYGDDWAEPLVQYVSNLLVSAFAHGQRLATSGSIFEDGEIDSSNGFATDGAISEILQQKLVEPQKHGFLAAGFNDSWINTLRRFAAEAGDAGSGNSPLRVAFSPDRDTDRIQGRQLSRVLRLLGGLPNSPERDRHIYNYCNPIGKSDALYVVAFAHSTADAKLAEAMARAVPNLEWVIVTYKPRLVSAALRAGAIETADARDALEQAEFAAVLDAFSIKCRRYQIDESEFSRASPLFKMLAGDPRSRTLFLRGNCLAALADLIEQARQQGRHVDFTAGSLKPILKAIVRGADDFDDDMQALIIQHEKMAVHLDLVTPDWFATFAAAMQGWCGDGAHLEEREIIKTLQEEVASWPHPADAFDDALELIYAIDPPARRLAHQRLVALSPSGANASEGARFSARAGLRVLPELPVVRTAGG
jgi:hypothetical protein